MEEEQIFAQAKLAASTVKTLLAGSRVCHDHCVALFALCYVRTGAGNYSGYLVTESGGCPLEKNGVTSPKSFEIGATGRRGSDLQKHFSRPRLGNRQFFQANIKRRVKQGCKHGVLHLSHLGYVVERTLKRRMVGSQGKYTPESRFCNLLKRVVCQGPFLKSLNQE
jgi:hypothetical protein